MLTLLRRCLPLGTACALVAGAGCASRPAPRPAAAASTTPSDAAASPAAAGATSATSATPAAAPAAGPARLQLSLQTMEETTGGEFGLSLPMLLLLVRNDGPGEAQVPDLGIAMLLSLQVELHGAGRSEQRHATLYRAWPVTLSALAPGAVLQQGVSALSQGQRDLPLPLGSHQVKVCVQAEPQAAYPSAFTKTYGGLCSNEVTIEVKRRKGR